MAGLDVADRALLLDVLLVYQHLHHVVSVTVPLQELDVLTDMPLLDRCDDHSNFVVPLIHPASHGTVHWVWNRISWMTPGLVEFFVGLER